MREQGRLAQSGARRQQSVLRRGFVFQPVVQSLKVVLSATEGRRGPGSTEILEHECVDLGGPAGGQALKDVQLVRRWCEEAPQDIAADGNPTHGPVLVSGGLHHAAYIAGT